MIDSRLGIADLVYHIGSFLTFSRAHLPTFGRSPFFRLPNSSILSSDICILSSGIGDRVASVRFNRKKN